MATNIEPSGAIQSAKKWLLAAYSGADERIGNIGLEEVRWSRGRWEITLGFNREWDLGGDAANFVAGALSNPKRQFKVVVVSGSDNAILELRNREAA